jgi:hypothetical protein
VAIGSIGSTRESRLDFCSYAAAKFAMTWHYSNGLPAGRMVCIGVWEDGAFIGCLVFSRGAVYAIGSSYGLLQSEVCELTRIVLREHRTPTSRIVAIAAKLLRKQSPGLRLIVSYADPLHGHDGRGVYAAGNWIYVGLTKPECLIRVQGRVRHPRTIGSRYGTRDLPWLRAHVDANAEKVRTPPKHKYLFALDAGMRLQLEPLRQPYPTRERSTEIGTAVPTAGGGVIPTRSLQHEAGHV